MRGVEIDGHNIVVAATQPRGTADTPQSNTLPSLSLSLSLYLSLSLSLILSLSLSLSRSLQVQDKIILTILRERTFIHSPLCSS